MKISILFLMFLTQVWALDAVVPEKSVVNLQNPAILKTADESVNSTTLQNDDELSADLQASATYRFEVVLYITTGSAVEGIKVALQGQGAPAYLKAQVFFYDDTLNTLVKIARITAFGTAKGTAGLSQGSGAIIIKGTLKTSTAGPVSLQWAQQAAGAASTVVEAGSFSYFQRID